jgi:H+-transporting ATPase
MIEAAIVMSALIQHWADFAIIALLLALNAIVGFWQEHQAGNAIEQLKQRLAPTARFLRDGKWQEKPARELVPRARGCHGLGTCPFRLGLRVSAIYNY